MTTPYHRLALAVALPLLLAASPALAQSAGLAAAPPAPPAPPAQTAAVLAPSPTVPPSVVLRSSAPRTGRPALPQRASTRRRQRGVPQYVYTALVVGMSALTIGLGVDAALDSRAGRAN